MTQRTSAALWLTGVGLSSGAGALALFVPMMKMNWASAQGMGFAVSVASLTLGCILGIWAWLVIFTKLGRKAN